MDYQIRSSSINQTQTAQEDYTENQQNQTIQNSSQLALIHGFYSEFFEIQNSPQKMSIAEQKRYQILYGEDLLREK